MEHLEFYALLIVTLLLTYACVSNADELKSKNVVPQCSMYVPTCFDTHPTKEEKRNMVFLMGGTGLQPGNLPYDATFKLGYFREVKDDLSLGVVTDWTKQGNGFAGWAIGFGYRF